MDWADIFCDWKTYVAIYAFMAIFCGPPVIRQITKGWEMWYYESCSYGTHYSRHSNRSRKPDYASPYAFVCLMLLVGPFITIGYVLGYGLIYRFLIRCLGGLLIFKCCRPVIESCLPETLRIPKE